MHTDAHQKRRGQHDERDMAQPAEVAADFILIKSQIFGGLQVLFNAPPCANGLHNGGERRGLRSKDQVVSQLVRGVQAATHNQEMAAVNRACLDPGQHGPVKKPLAFGAQALTEALPVLLAKGLLGDGGDRVEQVALRGLDTDDFGARNGHRVGEALRLEEGAQVGAVPVDGISHHPVDGQTSRLSALEHAPGQFGFGLKGDGLGDVGSEPASRVIAPVFGQVQLAIDEAMALHRHVV